MWLLEGEAFEGRKLWLRPGKTYLLGRTEAEPGQLTISHKTISRKHLTIQVDTVASGDGRNLQSRSRITIEDLNAKKGTLLNGIQIRGEKHVLSGEANEIQMGSCPQLFRISWFPVVLTFSFTAKELRADPWSKLRDQLEHLDIKYSSEYENGHTSHVVTKKRNTSKGLQALIYGSYIVTESFIKAVVQAASPPHGAVEGMNSPLEADFQANWPEPLEHLPPRGEEPSERPATSYTPDERRQDIFEGYTFVFYEKKQYENLLPAITSGKGKALLREAVPRETEVNDFIRYVKDLAGDKGLGSFDDGNEGKGVVVVRYGPGPKGSDIEWFVEFLNTFAQHLDHRPIDQREFLEAILSCDASMLRRPLEEDTQVPSTNTGVPPSGSRMEIDQPANDEPAPRQALEQEPSGPSRRRARPKRGGESRFRGFALDSDDETTIIEERMLVSDATAATEQNITEAAATQDSLFVSQNPNHVQDLEFDDEEDTSRRPQRKRPFSAVSPTQDEIAPVAAAVKRQRIEAGIDPTHPASSPRAESGEDDDMAVEEPSKPVDPEMPGKTGSRVKRDTLDPKEILELARQRREEAEAKAAAEHKALVELPEDGIDYAAIRRMHIIEDCEVHYPDPESNARTREQEIADGRWDPSWNGRKNFKKFRKHGDPAGRPAPRIIIGLEEAKPKGYGIGDDYWLEGEEGTHRDNPSNADSQSQDRVRSQSQPVNKEKEKVPPRPTIGPDSSDEDSLLIVNTPRQPRPDSELSRTRAGKAAEKANSLRSQSQADSQTRAAAPRASGKRTGAAPSAQEKQVKKPRRFIELSDSEDSEDGLRFKFGRRR